MTANHGSCRLIWVKRALHAEAGIAQGTELKVAYYEGFENIEGQMVQSWLAGIGLKLTWQEMSFPAFLDSFIGDAAAAERPDMCLFSWWPNVDHPYSYAWSLFSGKATSADGNSGHYIIAKATGLIDGLNNQLMDPGNIAKVLRLADTLTTEEPAWLPAQQVRTQFVSRTDIAGLVNNPFDVATLDRHHQRHRLRQGRRARLRQPWHHGSPGDDRQWLILQSHHLRGSLRP